MSFKYGLNGNDINWESLETANQKCCDCKQGENDTCDGHTIKYSKRGWSLFHDTNDNFVRVSGNVPMDIYTSDYITDWFNDMYTKENTLNRIFKELIERKELPKVVGVWGISNTASLNVYLLHDTNVDHTAYVGINNDIPKLLPVLEDTAGEETQYYVNFGSSKYYLNECMKV